MLGPIDYIIVGFEGNKFDGSILKALTDAMDKGVINLLALALIVKGADGSVAKFGLNDLGDAFAEFESKQQNPDYITQEDVDEMSDLLENNTAAGLLIIEQLWAKPLKQALLDTNGVLIAEGRIHPDAAAELTAERSK